MDYLEVALRLGQDPNLIEAIQQGKCHPAMAAFGLWDDREFENLTDEIYANRERMVSRLAIEFETDDF
jgi:hypothetical protein